MQDGEAQNDHRDHDGDHDRLLDEKATLEAAVAVELAVGIPTRRIAVPLPALQATATFPDFSVLSHFISAPRAS